MLPNLTGTGRLTSDPDLRFTPSGKALCKVSLAFNSRRFNRQTNEWEDGDVFFVTGTLWDAPAENAAETLKKGMEVVATGRLKTRQWETDDGQKRSMPELVLDSIGPSLRYAQATVRKIDRNAGDGGSSWRSSGGQGGTGGQDQSGYEDPWGSAPPAGSGGQDDEPPF